MRLKHGVPQKQSRFDDSLRRSQSLGVQRGVEVVLWILNSSLIHAQKISLKVLSAVSLMCDSLNLFIFFFFVCVLWFYYLKSTFIYNPGVFTQQADDPRSDAFSKLIAPPGLSETR
ncbi:hypothetical protein KC19_VG323200 [Ceratodon purpureus]|uniref:Uncharacterized protein n=1 Tax=Ceratodon purpureus TaxID=3225 RepID=A0A8T0HVN3_CERPU|nr:hypothetical protein KC19_VG323200 [Ceratodon purpureus]